MVAPQMFGSKPFMSDPEIDLILGWIGKEHTMLEWGSGVSTIFFSQRVRRYFSIEHDPQWHWPLADKLFRLKLDNVRLFLVPPNQTLDGLPNYARPSAERYAQFRDYVDQVAKLGVARFDRVLIDGRSRPECAKKVLPYLSTTSIVFIHDYFNTQYERAEYHRLVAEDYETVDEIREGQSLAVLRPKTEGMVRKSTRLYGGAELGCFGQSPGWLPQAGLLPAPRR